jgi:hypothetical protein
MQSAHWKITSTTEENLTLSGWWPFGGSRGLSLSKTAVTLSYARSELSLHTKDITSLRCSVSPSRSGRLLFGVHLFYNTKDGGDQKSFSFQVKNINRYEDALDFLLRVGQLLGWGFYTLHRKSDDGFELTLHPDDGGPFRADSQNTKEVPRSSQPIQTLRSITSHENFRPRFQAPSGYVDDFLPNSISSVGSAWLVDWNPGKRVHLRRNPARGMLLALLHTLFVVPLRFLFVWLFVGLFASGVVAAIAIAIVLLPSLLVGLFSQEAETSLLIIVGTAVGGLSLAYLTYLVVRDTIRDVLRSFSYSATLDWEKDQLQTTRATYFSATRPLSSVHAISLVECNDDLSNTDDKTEKWYEVRAQFGWRWVALWESRQYKNSSQWSSTGKSLAVSLARALDVPYREDSE